MVELCDRAMLLDLLEKLAIGVGSHRMIGAMFHDRSKRQTVLLALFSTATVTALFQLQGHLSYSLWDEGFFWYGAQRVMLGEVPIRDFMAYDPGRYYWSAAIMSLMSDNGIIANRVAAAIFQTIGLFFGLFLLVRNERPIRLAPLILAAGTFILWMYPREKLFDAALSIVLVAILTHLIQQPSPKRIFLTGLVIGFVAVFGRNHGIYGALGSIGALIYLNVKRLRPSYIADFRAWVAGVIIGYSPIILCLIVIPGFAAAFWESIEFLFEIKGTNLPLPVPWPWRVDLRQYWSDAARDVLVGSFFVAVLVFGVLGLGGLFRSKIKNTVVSPVFAASVLLALPYAHFAYSRADVTHLAHGIFPFLIGVMALTAGRSAGLHIFTVLVLFAASLVVMLPHQPAWQSYRAKNWLNINIARDKLTVDPGTAYVVRLLSTLVEKYALNGRAFIATPFWPGAYAAFARKSPMWEIYALFPRSATFQEREIQRIKQADPGFALVFDHALDGREELRFRITHPLIERYIRENYEPLDVLDKGSPFQIYVNKRFGP